MDLEAESARRRELQERFGTVPDLTAVPAGEDDGEEEKGEEEEGEKEAVVAVVEGRTTAAMKVDAKPAASGSKRRTRALPLRA